MLIHFRDWFKYNENLTEIQRLTKLLTNNKTYFKAASEQVVLSFSTTLSWKRTVPKITIVISINVLTHHSRYNQFMRSRLVLVSIETALRNNIRHEYHTVRKKIHQLGLPFVVNLACCPITVALENWISNDCMLANSDTRFNSYPGSKFASGSPYLNIFLHSVGGGFETFGPFRHLHLKLTIYQHI